MIRASREAVRRWTESLLHIHDTPRRTAAAFALGVFVSFSPPLGLHTPLVLLFAFALNLNRVAALLGCYANLPWILPAYYALVTAAGARLLGISVPHGFRSEFQHIFLLFSPFESEFWYRLSALLRPLLWPYIVGSTLGAAILAAAAYHIALAFVLAHHRHARHR